MCVIRCLSHEKCCEASYDISTSICRLDTSENCCVDMEIVDGWETFKTDIYETPCTGCVSYGTSSYKFSVDSKSWADAKISCVCLKGKFLEAETTEENNFIKAELNTMNTGNDVFGKKMMSIAGGFLVPLKTKGSIRLVDLSTGTPQRPTEITTGSDDHHWFYHRVLWLDMNGDGKKDAVTCRAKKSLLGSGTGQLVWYEHPQTDSISNPWHHFIIADHSDTFFDITTLTTPTGTNTVIVTTGFFSNQLKIYWTTDPAGKWTDTLKIKSRVIEEHIGHVFDVQIDDVNNDGKSDLLVTSNGLSNTAVYVYEIPADFRFIDSVLAMNILTFRFINSIQAIRS
ncbi:unnamed protein product [Mytilus edulis]|uniref:Uncharacterized protein n=1 Tax=Mytilus edulis TaxID=6550 RepID=A0A8S3PX58_MYTED|nr:unnamed protein product [Mytilus edulis]